MRTRNEDGVRAWMLFFRSSRSCEIFARLSRYFGNFCFWEVCSLPLAAGGGSFKNSGTFASLGELHAVNPWFLRLVAISRVRIASPETRPNFPMHFKSSRPPCGETRYQYQRSSLSLTLGTHTGLDRNDNIKFVTCNWRTLPRVLLNDLFVSVYRLCIYEKLDRIYMVCIDIFI